VHEGEADPAYPPRQVRRTRRLHEQRIPERDKGTHALRTHPRATGVRRRATRRGEYLAPSSGHLSLDRPWSLPVSRLKRRAGRKSLHVLRHRGELASAESLRKYRRSPDGDVLIGFFRSDHDTLQNWHHRNRLDPRISYSLDTYHHPHHKSRRLDCIFFHPPSFITRPDRKKNKSGESTICQKIRQHCYILLTGRIHLFASAGSRSCWVARFR
jgi:hypothetical protein